MSSPRSLLAWGLVRESSLALLALASATYLQLWRSLPVGWRRLAVAAPVLLAFATAPLLYDRHTEPFSLMLAINFPWLCNSAVGARHGRGSGCGSGWPGLRHFPSSHPRVLGL